MSTESSFSPVLLANRFQLLQAIDPDNPDCLDQVESQGQENQN